MGVVRLVWVVLVEMVVQLLLVLSSLPLVDKAEEMVMEVPEDTVEQMVEQVDQRRDLAALVEAPLLVVVEQEIVTTL